MYRIGDAKFLFGRQAFFQFLLVLPFFLFLLHFLFFSFLPFLTGRFCFFACPCLLEFLFYLLANTPFLRWKTQSRRAKQAN